MGAEQEAHGAAEQKGRGEEQPGEEGAQQRTGQNHQKAHAEQDGPGDFPGREGGLRRRSRRDGVRRGGGALAQDQLIQRDAKYAAQLDQLVQIGDRAVGLPFGDGLAGDAQSVGQAVLGEVLLGAKPVDGFAKGHRWVLL